MKEGATGSVALALIALAACRSGVSGSLPDGTASPPDACMPGQSPVPYTGQIVFTYTSTPSDSYSVAADFEPAPACAASDPCTTRVGQCCYVARAQAMVPMPVSAGVITIGTLATMTPAGGMYFPVRNPPTTSLAWSAESNLVADVAGDVVHAFQTQVTTPGAPTNVSPSFDAPLTIARANDFDFSWSPGFGEVTLVITAGSGGSHGSIRCTAPQDFGSMTVPAALLQDFAAGDTGTVTLTRTYSVVDSPDNAGVLTSANGVVSAPASYP